VDKSFCETAFPPVVTATQVDSRACQGKCSTGCPCHVRSPSPPHSLRRRRQKRLCATPFGRHFRDVGNPGQYARYWHGVPCPYVETSCALRAFAVIRGHLAQACAAVASYRTPRRDATISHFKGHPCRSRRTRPSCVQHRGYRSRTLPNPPSRTFSPFRPPR